VLLQEASIGAVGVGEDDFELALTGETELNPTLRHLLAEQFGIILPLDLDDLIAPGQFDPQPVFDRLTKEAATVRGFSVAARRVLGTFSYAKLPMVNDLNGNVEALIAHDVVAAIAGHRPAQLSLAATGSDVDVTAPDRSSPADEYLVLRCRFLSKLRDQCRGRRTVGGGVWSAWHRQVADDREPHRESGRAGPERAVRGRETRRGSGSSRPAQPGRAR
jgi:hypothetical protein